MTSLKEVQGYIGAELAAYGFNVKEERFFFANQTYSNLVARFEKDVNLPRLIVGAHFDAVPGSPGADDNASGVAALLEAAKIYSDFYSDLAPQVYPQPYCVEFVAFNLEEYGMAGSQAYVRKLKSDKTRLVGMLSLEMVGFTSQTSGSQKMPFFLKPFYPDTGNFIGLVANTRSKGLLEKVRKVFESVKDLPTESLVLPANGWVFPDARLSDHSPFWDAAFPALLVTDTSFYRNPHYHTGEDRIETLDLEFLTKVTAAVAKTCCEIL